MAPEKGHCTIDIDTIDTFIIAFPEPNMFITGLGANLALVYIHVHDEPQLLSLRTANRPRCMEKIKSPTAQDTFRPMQGLISCAGVTGSITFTLV